MEHIILYKMKMEHTHQQIVKHIKQQMEALQEYKLDDDIQMVRKGDT